MATAEAINRCPRCRGFQRRTSPGELTCANCGHVSYLDHENGHRPLPFAIEFDSWEKNEISNALTEIQMRCKGNAQRSTYEVTKQLNEERAQRLEQLIAKIQSLPSPKP